MRYKTFVKWFGLLVVVLVLFPRAGAAAQQEAESLIGQEVSFFTLPSTEGRAINYLREYYGKHPLVITFFPAAFTPT